MPKARFAIGIDLGTTQSSLAYIDLEASEAAIQLLPIPQWENPQELRADVRLPSCVYILPKNVQKKGGRAHPIASDQNEPHVLGREAKAQSLIEPERVIQSAKSWLSLGNYRDAEVLPWGSSLVEEKLSPVAVQSLYLKHLALAWEQAFPSAPFIDQKIVITVPASFDELAQRLTLAAAQRAGYPSGVTLLEEPQAALYDWYRQHPQLKDQRVLVCDVGGGTTDFTLIAIDQGRMKRLRVSEHLLLGGDNIDLALAHRVAPLLSPEELPRHAWQSLLTQVRKLKEDGLDAASTEDFYISVPKVKNQLFGEFWSITLKADDLRQWILDGFLPAVEPDAKPERGTGLKTFGLPYAEDSAITRHVAHFLKGEQIDSLLCVGGTLLPDSLRKKLSSVIEGWQKSHPLTLLNLDEIDLAVAKGAAFFAWSLLKQKELIASEYPRSLYLELASEKEDSAPRYMTLIPKGQKRLESRRLALPGLHLRTGSVVVGSPGTELEFAL